MITQSGTDEADGRTGTSDNAEIRERGNAEYGSMRRSDNNTLVKELDRKDKGTLPAMERMEM